MSECKVSEFRTTNPDFQCYGARCVGFGAKVFAESAAESKPQHGFKS